MLEVLMIGTDIVDTKGVFWIVAGVVAVVAIGAGTISSVCKTRARERTKREIAAYVAEGTIDPKDAVKMLKAGRKIDEEEDEE
jgi:hypothetical protein